MKIKTLLAAGLLAWTLPLSAFEADEPCFFSGDGCGFRQYHIFGGAEALYWTVFQSNLDFAVDFDNSEEAEKILGPGKTHFLDYDWKPGGRAWLGWNWGCGWDARAVYTYYYNRAEGSVDHSGSDTGLKASLLHPSTGLSDAEIAHGHNSLTYQTVDALIGKVICICDDTFMFRPYLGVRCMRLNENQWATYEGGDFEDFPARVTFNSELQAAGLHAGFASNFCWPCGLGLYGGLAGSLLATRTDIEHHQYELDSDFHKEDTLINLKERQYVVIPALHINAGVAWDYYWGCCMTVRFKAGYEFNQYFDTPQPRRYHYGNEGVSNSATSSNITLQGATCSLELYF